MSNEIKPHNPDGLESPGEGYRFLEEGLLAVARHENYQGAMGDAMTITECYESVDDRWPQIKKMGGL